MNAHLLLLTSTLLSFGPPKRQVLHFADGTARHTTLPGWNIVIQYYFFIPFIPEAAHSLTMFYSGMIQRALQVSVAIPRRGVPFGLSIRITCASEA